MCDRTCEKCGECFQFPSQLKKHHQRKKSCVPQENVNDRAHCPHCNRGFTTNTAMYRHVRNTCKAAKDDKPKAAAPVEPAPVAADQQFKEVLTQLAQLRVLVEQKLPAAVAPVTDLQPIVVANQLSGLECETKVPRAGIVNIQTNNVQTNNVQNNITIQAAPVNITPWDSPEYITVSLADILAAFAENPKLRQYLHMDDFELSDFEKAPPYVIELFIELLLRAHLLEVARNIYLNPSRADQVMVRMKSGSWDVAPLNDAIEHLFNGIARRLHVITITNEERTKLPYDIQNAISICEMMYKDHPDVYIKLAKEVIVAHLTNCRARLIESGAIVQKPRK